MCVSHLALQQLKSHQLEDVDPCDLPSSFPSVASPANLFLEWFAPTTATYEMNHHLGCKLKQAFTVTLSPIKEEVPTIVIDLSRMVFAAILQVTVKVTS